MYMYADMHVKPHVIQFWILVNGIANDSNEMERKA